MHDQTEASERAGAYDGCVTAEAVEQIFSASADFQSRTIHPGLRPGIPATVCWIDGAVNAEAMAEELLRPLSDPERLGDTTTSRACEQRILHGAV